MQKLGDVTFSGIRPSIVTEVRDLGVILDQSLTMGIARLRRTFGADGGGKWDQLIPLPTPLCGRNRRARAGPVRTRGRARHFLLKEAGRAHALLQKVGFSPPPPSWARAPMEPCAQRAVPATRTELWSHASSRDDPRMAAHTSFCGCGNNPHLQKEAG